MDCTHAVCATYDTVASTLTSVPSAATISPNNAEMSAVLPEPTGPTTIVNSPRLSSRSISCKNGPFFSAGATSDSFAPSSLASTCFFLSSFGGAALGLDQ